jgi:alanine dehydrogenase
MLIGVPKEIKPQENRVGLTPESVSELVHAKHQVIVQTQAGSGIGCDDAAYRAAGAQIAASAAEVFAKAGMIVKVKEPQAIECGMLRKGQILFTYLHLAPDPEQAQMLQDSGAVCIAYETVTSPTGGLPLLAPMSEVAGRMAVQSAASHLEKIRGGKGMLLGGVPGVPPAHVLILGAGVVGTHALQMAVGMGAKVTVVDKSVDRLRQLDLVFGNRIATRYSTSAAIDALLPSADVVIGGVLIPGASAPKLVRREHLKMMEPGTVLVDVAIDQGGCFETSRATTHAEPTYIEESIVHYCVANMPGGVPRTSTFALNNATLPFTLALANKGWKKALTDDAHLREGLNVCDGQITHKAVAKALNKTYANAQTFL